MNSLNKWQKGTKYLSEHFDEICDMLEIPEPCRSCKLCYIGIEADIEEIENTMMDVDSTKTWEFFYMRGTGTYNSLCAIDKEEGLIEHQEVLDETGGSCQEKGKPWSFAPRWVVKNELEKYRKGKKIEKEGGQ